MRYRLAAAVMAACLIATSQTQGLSVEKLVAFVQSSQKIIAEGKMTDRELANFLSKTRMTERLEDRTIEDLEGLGVGPKTLQALNRLRDESKLLATAAPLVPKAAPKPIPPPSSEEQAAIIDDVREYALNYSKNLPDFICTQVTRRYAAAQPGTKYGGPAGSRPSWQSLDTLTIRLSYFDQKEDYKLILVNSTPASQDYKSVGGSTSYGDFGSMMKQIFEPATQAQFEWDHWGTLHGRRVMAFAYTVAQSRSQWHIVDKDAGKDIVPAYRGLVEVEPSTHKIMRVTLVAEDIPADFPVKKAEEILDYDFTDISGHSYLLPLKGEMNMAASEFLTRNVMEFRMYRKYSAESEIKYDADTTALPPLPDEKTQEVPDPGVAKPVINCKDPKNRAAAECKP